MHACPQFNACKIVLRQEQELGSAKYRPVQAGSEVGAAAGAGSGGVQRPASLAAAIELAQSGI